MEHNEEPELSLLLAPVDPPDGEEGEGKPEGGDEVKPPLPHWALKKLGRAQDTMEGHNKHVEEDETAEDEGFKKPNLANITLARLMPKKSSAMPSSPIAGGNLGPTVRIWLLYFVPA